MSLWITQQYFTKLNQLDVRILPDGVSSIKPPYTINAYSNLTNIQEDLISPQRILEWAAKQTFMLLPKWTLLIQNFWFENVTGLPLKYTGENKDKNQQKTSKDTNTKLIWNFEIIGRQKQISTHVTSKTFTQQSPITVLTSTNRFYTTLPD